MKARLTAWLETADTPQRLAVLRAIVGTYATVFLVLRFPHIWNAADRPSRMWEPIGVLAPIAHPPAPWIARSALVAGVAAGALYVSGRAYRFAGPVFAAFFLLVTTYRLSWGSVLHTEHLVVLHVIILGVAPAAGRRASHPHDSGEWALHAAALVTALGYLVSGITKLRLGGWDWLSGEPLRNQVAFDNLRKSLLGDTSSPLAGWAVRNRAMFGIFAPVTIAIELLAPLALAWRRFRAPWITTAWLFHFGVLAIMAIFFPYQLTAVAFAPLVLLPTSVGRRTSSARPRGRPAGRTCWGS